LPWGFCIPLLPWPTYLFRPEAFVLYENSLRDAAVKRPADSVPLKPLDFGKTKELFANFSFGPPQTDGQQPAHLKGDKWVALPDEIRKACAGKPDSTRALQQILGLPPTLGKQMVYEITVDTDHVFRPCQSGRATGVAKCTFELPPAPPRLGDAATTDQKAEAYAALLLAYDEIRFVTDQMWQSCRTGFPNEHAMPGDYPFTGHPFTGMGWTYNWDPTSQTHVGVSEFIARDGAEITVERAFTPEQFCQSTP
jgi:hypothetical protein